MTTNCTRFYRMNSMKVHAYQHTNNVRVAVRGNARRAMWVTCLIVVRFRAAGAYY